MLRNFWDDEKNICVDDKIRYFKLMREKYFYVYIVTNLVNTVLYIGMTSDLCRRIWEHREGRGSIFAAKYKTTRLVYYELHYTFESAADREKELKKWERQWKNNLITAFNPQWLDLYDTLVPDN